VTVKPAARAMAARPPMNVPQIPRMWRRTRGVFRP
jgi:hypothetical protein